MESVKRFFVILFENHKVNLQYRRYLNLNSNTTHKTKGAEAPLETLINQGFRLCTGRTVHSERIAPPKAVALA